MRWRWLRLNCFIVLPIPSLVSTFFAYNLSTCRISFFNLEWITSLFIHFMLSDLWKIEKFRWERVASATFSFVFLLSSFQPQDTERQPKKKWNFVKSPAVNVSPLAVGLLSMRAMPKRKKRFLFILFCYILSHHTRRATHFIFLDKRTKKQRILCCHFLFKLASFTSLTIF